MRVPRVLVPLVAAACAGSNRISSGLANFLAQF